MPRERWPSFQHRRRGEADVEGAVSPETYDMFHTPGKYTPPRSRCNDVYMIRFFCFGRDVETTQQALRQLDFHGDVEAGGVPPSILLGSGIDA